MARTDFETLRVYNLAEELADKIWDIGGPALPPDVRKGSALPKIDN